MPEADHQQQLRAADITCESGTVTARLVGPVIEQHRGRAIVDSVSKAIAEADEAVRYLVLDFSEITFINSSGIAACIELRNDLHEKGSKSIIFQPTVEVAEIFRKVKLDQLYTIARTSNELLDAIGAKARPEGQ